MKEKDLIFINTLRDKIRHNPSLTHVAILAINSGVEDAVREANEYGRDIETVASAAIAMLGEKRVSKKVKEQFENLALSKLEKHKDRTFCNWEWAIKKNDKSS